jgi:hypothetical protein
MTQGLGLAHHQKRGLFCVDMGTVGFVERWVNGVHGGFQKRKNPQGANRAGVKKPTAN